MKTFRELVEAKKTSLKDVVDILSDENDWSDMKDFVKIEKGKLRVLDSYFYGGDKALQSLKDEWTSTSGTYYKYFKEEYNITFKLVDEFIQVKAEKKFQKLTTDGIIGIYLTIK